MRDELGDRMKSHYENRTRYFLPRKSYSIIRVDGKAFHTYTKGFTIPFDDNLMEVMDTTAKYLCKNIMGAKFAFVQSDEISLLLTDFDNINTESWFDSNIQKMVSVSASMATRAFNEAMFFKTLAKEIKLSDLKWAEFDSRVFQIPQKIEVENYFIWRQQDTVRNSIASVAQSLYSSKQLHGKNVSEQQEMIFQKGINWNDYAPRYKRGRLIVKKTYEKEETLRTYWDVTDPLTFTQDRKSLSDLIPDFV
jgi:tRNA(His) guanylyltransferase